MLPIELADKSKQENIRQPAENFLENAIMQVVCNTTRITFTKMCITIVCPKFSACYNTERNWSIKQRVFQPLIISLFATLGFVCKDSVCFLRPLDFLSYSLP